MGPSGVSGRRTTSGGSDDERGRGVTETAESGRFGVDVAAGTRGLGGRKGNAVYARIKEVDRDEMDEEREYSNGSGSDESTEEGGGGDKSGSEELRKGEEPSSVGKDWSCLS